MNYSPTFIKSFTDAWPEEKKYHVLVKEGNVKEIERFLYRKNSPITLNDILKVETLDELHQLQERAREIQKAESLLNEWSKETLVYTAR